MVTLPTRTAKDFLRKVMASFYLMAARIIYSTGIGSLCPNCRRAVRDCVCPKGAPGVVKPGAVRVGREVKGRAGKGVTTVQGLPLAELRGFETK